MVLKLPYIAIIGCYKKDKYSSSVMKPNIDLNNKGEESNKYINNSQGKILHRIKINTFKVFKYKTRKL